MVEIGRLLLVYQTELHHLLAFIVGEFGRHLFFDEMECPCRLEAFLGDQDQLSVAV